ncbi:DUF4328 domain-containing protein [Streptomyces iconiensis]|uniref:DUF4328 domain-containing protein n=1 Tax=Streptomyces iconiensis TaxID=1384038 RepID=A0ABT7A0N2_9ACTN|nr:DUF4328 domain-containing protein [Streptomyces iconiensis]MDJ1134866.1 DUF4328 domain-containing protein [Streptomyces iconiensis]
MNDDIASPSLGPVRTTARWAVAALALVGAAWVARALWQLQLAISGMPGSGPPDQGDGQHRPLTGLENAYHLVAAAGDVLTVVCVIAFLSWLLRVRDNARVLSSQPLRYAGLWVYAGWIVPIANLWVPRGIVADIHRASAPDERLPRAVNWWWGLWLAGMLSGAGLVYADSSKDEIIARAYNDVPLLLAADATVIGAAVAGILVVRALSAAQQRHLDG